LRPRADASISARSFCQRSKGLCFCRPYGRGDGGIESNTKIKIKGNGQECPFHRRLLSFPIWDKYFFDDQHFIAFAGTRLLF